MEVKLYLYSVDSLKEKRGIIKSLMGRLGSRYNISIAEVDLNDILDQSVIGISLVSNNKSHLESSIGKVLSFIENDTRVEIVEENIEIV